jgi:hypothetical protein
MKIAVGIISVVMIVIAVVIAFTKVNSNKFSTLPAEATLAKYEIVSEDLSISYSNSDGLRVTNPAGQEVIFELDSGINKANDLFEGNWQQLTSESLLLDACNKMIITQTIKPGQATAGKIVRFTCE